ncbi:MAG: MBL fold metallo-hydrolase [Candidatus Kappaea frigidicola]|nr:MBL fold metallo-hydrolase [Candidatus Kappaea frigidicola]
MSVKVKFCGGVRTVTGSTHLIETSKSKVLIDCGLFQGKRDDYYQINSTFTFDPAKVNALIVSHAHIDHCGNIPNFTKQGFHNKIYTTEATADLCKIMLLDSAHIQEENIKFLNKINKRRRLPLRKPLYTTRDAEKSLDLFEGMAYNTKFQVTEDISCTFIDAGHILGSAIIVLNIKAQGEKEINLAYAVDLGRANMPLLKDPVFLPKGFLDYLIIESTYGGRLRGDIQYAEDDLSFYINRTVERGGKVIIPSFALGRSQEIIYYLSELMKGKKIPELPIYVDSPMAVNVTGVFKKHIECFDEEARVMFYHDESPFGIKNLHFTRSVEESKKINDDKSPMIIISASGMCEAGRILHHLKNNIEDEKNMVLIVGYMAKNTLGRRMVERHPRVKIFGVEYNLRAEVEVINAFSAHADKEDLINYVRKSDSSLKGVYIVHGDEDQSTSLLDSLVRRGYNAHMPQIDEEVELI